MVFLKPIANNANPRTNCAIVEELDGNVKAMAATIIPSIICVIKIYSLSVGIAALAVFLLGLYTGHKISQRGFGEKLIAAQNSEYRRGLDSGIGMGADYIKELRSHCFKATHLNRKGMTIEEIKHKFEATHLTHEGVMAHAGNPKLMKTKVIDWSIYHRQIHHVKGAERLRE